MTATLKHDRIQRVADAIGEARRAGLTGKAIVDGLVADHGARLTTSPQTNTLTIAGITASCTWSTDNGLIDGWRRLATRRLMQIDGRAA